MGTACSHSANTLWPHCCLWSVSRQETLLFYGAKYLIRILELLRDWGGCTSLKTSHVVSLSQNAEPRVLLLSTNKDLLGKMITLKNGSCLLQSL